MSSDFRDLTDEIGPVPPTSPADVVAALRAVGRVAVDADEARMFAAMLGLDRGAA